VAIILHWLVALTVLGLFGLGLWMVELTYYDPWYRIAPEIHKGAGVLLLVVVLVRLAWRFANPRPRSEPEASVLERRVSLAVHRLLYAVPLLLMISGYLMSTADGRPIDVFGLFEVPATITGLPRQADLAGDAHAILAWSLIGLVVLHALAALKHHVVDRDRTLLRILWPSRT
jgi:cytochrome b561